MPGCVACSGAAADGQSSCPACGAPLHAPSAAHVPAVYQSSDVSLAEDTRQRQVHAAETRLLYDNACTGIVATIVIAAVLAYAQRDVRPQTIVMVWLLYVLLVSAARYALLRRYRRAPPGDTDSRRWSMAFAVGAGMAAAGWVVAAIVLYAPDEPMNQAFLVFVVGGVMLGGASLLAARPEAFLTFLLPTGLATALRLASEGDENHLMMGFLAAIFTAATVTTTWRFHRAIKSSLQLRFDNQDLVESLQAAKDQAEAVNRALEQRVRDRTARLTEADQRKNEFLAMLAHELRNPLAPIRFAIESLKLDTPPQLAARARDVIERQVQQLVRLVDDLLDVSRITVDKIQLHREPHDLSRLMETAVESIMPLASAAEQTLEVRPPSTPVHVYGDGARLVQIFTNVLNNAVKFTPRAGHIRFTADERPGEAVVCVRDSGMGIAPEALPRVFDMFHQAEPGLVRAAGGLGIGLTLARRLVEMHGGRIDISSPGPGQGTEVEIRLPIRAVQVDELPVDEQPARAVSHSLRVLIVEDNPDAAEMLDLAVSRLGHVTRLAHDGATAVALASEFVPDVIFLDIGLPVMDGYAVARAVRDRPEIRHVYIAAVTGWGQEEDRRKARDAGVDSHFTKPLSPAALEDVLGTAARRMTSGTDERATPQTRRTDSHPAL
jgi:signal transduction histidine kinase/AmiR/NasT family two-component response regulator